jgi:2-hydroxychromene-2-carboxylate isomerase
MPPSAPAPAARRADAADIRNRTVAQRGSRLGQPFQQEGEVPLVCLGIVRHQAKADHERQSAFVGLGDGVFQRMVPEAPLGLLHPVEHVAPRSLNARIEYLHTFRVYHMDL